MLWVTYCHLSGSTCPDTGACGQFRPAIYAFVGTLGCKTTLWDTWFSIVRRNHLQPHTLSICSHHLSTGNHHLLNIQTMLADIASSSSVTLLLTRLAGVKSHWCQIIVCKVYNKNHNNYVPPVLLPLCVFFRSKKEVF